MSGRGRGRGDRGSGSSDRGRGGSSGTSGSFRGFPPRGDSPSRGERGGFQGGRGDGGPRGGRGGGDPRGGAIQVHTAPSGGIPEPDPKVSKAEDDYIKQIKSAGLPDITTLEISDGAPRFPRRPAYGTRGKPVRLWANYFELLPPPDLLLYRYSVKVTERVVGKDRDLGGRRLNQVFRLLLEQPPLAGRRQDIVTDFKAQLISRTQFDDEVLRTIPNQIQYRAEGEDEAQINAPYYKIAVVSTGTVTVSELTDYLTSTNPRAALDKQPILQALNIFLGHYAKASPTHATVGSKSFLVNPSNDANRDLGAGLRAIRGFFSSVRVATSRILVNVNVSNAAFYAPSPLVQSIQNWGPPNGYNRVKLQAFLKYVRVKVLHIKAKKNKAGQLIPRVKTIFALATRNDGRGQGGLTHPPEVSEFAAGPRDVKFWLDDAPAEGSSTTPSATPAGKASGKKGKGKAQAPAGGSGRSGPPSGEVGGRYISVAEHFLNNYGMQTNANFPVVNVGTTARPSYLPAEACEIVPGQSSRAKLEPEQTQRMIAFAVRSPWLNARSIDQASPDEVGLVPQVNNDISRFGVTIRTQMITVPGRILDHPRVIYGNEGVKMFPASWNMESTSRRPLQFNTKSTLTSWRAIVLNVKKVGFGLSNARELAEVMANFHSALQKAGIRAQKPEEGRGIAMEDRNDQSLEDALKAVKEQLCLVILPAKDTVLYNRVKSIADTKCGIHTVCVVGKKVATQRGQDKYMANVALKFNLKLGGVNQKIDDAKLGIIAEGRTMVVGIDVTHPSPGSAKTAPSVAGMVASVDRYLAQWPAVLRVQKEARQENVDDLNSMLKTRLNLWATRNKQLPENILIYRDGVSEGQYEMVLRQELPGLRKACEEVYPATDLKKGLPKIAIIVVGKRHHTRFFPTAGDEKLTDKTGNPINGTVVDRHVTEARNWDFFLQAHNALQGTARPAHYFIVLDEIFTSRRLPAGFQNHADVLEDLTHNMCYLFGRATKAVSICPPAYYADLVCERARCYLSEHYDMATPSQTSAASESGQGAKPTNSDVQVHPNLKDSMFYI